MQCNVGKTDRLIRIIGGVLIIILGLLMHKWWWFMGILPIITGSIRWCPAYLPFRIFTNKNDTK